MIDATGGRRPPLSPRSRAAVVAGLVAVGITQPVLDLLGRNPEFFVAGRYSTGQIVTFGVAVAVVPAVAWALVVVVAGWLNRGVGTVVFLSSVSVLGALFGNVLVRGLGLDGLPIAVAATALGAGAALMLVRAKAGRMLLELLAAANVLFLVAFLLMSPTSRLLSDEADGDLGRIEVPDLPGPVVMIVFDELPLTTLLRADGSLNGDRYPGFAMLGERATWYRNASANHPRTERAVPAILTGRVTRAGQLPTYRDLPRNLLSLFGSAVGVHRYESITDMCPPDVCRARPRQSLSQAFDDALTVYGHRVLPDVLRDELPAIDTAWGGFDDLRGPGEAAAAEAPDYFPSGAGGLARWQAVDPSEQSPAGQIRSMLDAIDEMDEAGDLHFIHVVLPHTPWDLTPWGTQMLGPLPAFINDPSDPGFDASTTLRYQRHSLQVGAADAALKEVLDHLVDEGLWDAATIVVTSDHGISLLPPDFGREPTPANIEEVMRVPLFIKAPGQSAPEVVDEPALSIDILPTLIDLLGVETDWELEGHSLLDGSTATVDPAVSAGTGAVFELAARHASDYPRGEDWMGLAAVGAHADLVGTNVSELTMGEPSRLAWAPAHRETFDSLPTADGFAPQILTGSITGSREEAPPELVVSVNGTIGGVTRIHSRSSEGWTFYAFLGPVLAQGSNVIQAYEVERLPSGAVLHALG